MLIKSNAIERFLRENPTLNSRRYGLPSIGNRHDFENFNKSVQNIADAINYYGYEIRDENITTIKDIDLGTGNPLRFKPFPLSIKEMKKCLDEDDLSGYPYTEGDDRIRKILLDYIEGEGIYNDRPYTYSDIDEKGLSVHNITFMPSTSIIFNIIVSIISKPGDVILIPAPNYGLFTIRAEIAGADVQLLPLEKEDDFYVNPEKLALKIDEINESLQTVYNKRKGYIPRVVAFLNANPNNPTGKALGEKDVDKLQKIGEVCLERGVFVIDDLVYRDITFDKDNIAKPMASLPGMFRNTISLFGLSKSYSLASIRAGFVVADESIITEMVNRIFQSMDSSPVITGYALAGAFNNTLERKKVYQEYFDELRSTYIYKYNLLKAMIDGIDTVDKKYKEEIKTEIVSVLGKNADKVLNGIPLVKFAHDLKPDAGFFAILDFTELKGRKHNGRIISTERDVLKFFYKTYRIRFLVGQSICWPYEDELVGRVSFAIDNKLLIDSIYKMGEAISKLSDKSDFIIRFNRIEDQKQMARIKVDGWQKTYDRIISSKYLKQLNYEEQTQKYYRSFEEYKDLVLVAVKNNEVLGYSCFDVKEKTYKYDSELVSLYVKNDYHYMGIGTALFNETCKELLSRGRKDMIVWCLKENTPAIDFYSRMGGIKSEEKLAVIGDNKYLEYGFYFDLEQFDKDNSF